MSLIGTDVHMRQWTATRIFLDCCVTLVACLSGACNQQISNAVRSDTALVPPFLHDHMLHCRPDNTGTCSCLHLLDCLHVLVTLTRPYLLLSGLWMPPMLGQGAWLAAGMS